MGPRPGWRVVDLGGTPELWELLDLPLDITLVNCSATAMRGDSGATRHTYRTVVADACDLPMFADGEFDLAFSNSVIEHVGSPAREAAFAREVRRIAPRFWVQTPSPAFPLEAHCNLPAWWLYPEPLKRRLIARWRTTGDEFLADQMAGTRALSRARLRALFPGCAVYTERVAGLPKSHCAHTPRP